jgi:hypothetical protein
VSSPTSSRARKQAQSATLKKRTGRNGASTTRRTRKNVDRAADEFIAKNAEVLAELAK